MGPNGSGIKSHLTSVIAGKEEFLSKQKGEVIFRGENLERQWPEERAHKGVFLFFSYPCLKFLEFRFTLTSENRRLTKVRKSFVVLEGYESYEMLKLIVRKAEMLEIDRKIFLSRFH